MRVCVRVFTNVWQIWMKSVGERERIRMTQKARETEKREGRT